MFARKPSYFLAELSPLSKTFALLTNQQAANVLRNECSCVKPVCTSFFVTVSAIKIILQLSCKWVTQMMPGGDIL